MFDEISLRLLKLKKANPPSPTMYLYYALSLKGSAFNYPLYSVVYPHIRLSLPLHKNIPSTINAMANNIVNKNGLFSLINIL